MLDRFYHDKDLSTMKSDDVVHLEVKMYHISSDSREQQSAALLSDASRQILQKKDAKMNISQLCETAGVSRSTFYRLFDAIDDVLCYSCEKLLDTSLSDYLVMIRDGVHRSPASVYADLVRSYSKEIQWMIKNGKIGILLQTHRTGLRKYAREFFPSMDSDSEEFIYFLDMRFGLILGAFTAWLSTGKKATVDEIVSYAEQQIRFIER